MAMALTLLSMSVMVLVAYVGLNIMATLMERSRKKKLERGVRDL
jgi:hypothetical protein